MRAASADGGHRGGGQGRQGREGHGDKEQIENCHDGSFTVSYSTFLYKVNEIDKRFMPGIKREQQSHKIPRVEAGKLLCFRLAES